MFFYWVYFFISLLGLFLFLRKKLLSLLMLELFFLTLIFGFFFYSFLGVTDVSYFLMMVFLGFLVLDSVLGLCCLISSSRNSNSFLNSFFSV